MYSKTRANSHLIFFQCINSEKFWSFENAGQILNVMQLSFFFKTTAVT